MSITIEKPSLLNPFPLLSAHLGNVQHVRPAPRLLLRIIGNNGKYIETLISRNSITIGVPVLIN